MKWMFSSVIFPTNSCIKSVCFNALRSFVCLFISLVGAWNFFLYSIERLITGRVENFLKPLTFIGEIFQFFSFLFMLRKLFHLHRLNIWEKKPHKKVNLSSFKLVDNFVSLSFVCNHNFGRRKSSLKQSTLVADAKEFNIVETASNEKIKMKSRKRLWRWTIFEHSRIFTRFIVKFMSFFVCSKILSFFRIKHEISNRF